MQEEFTFSNLFWSSWFKILHFRRQNILFLLLSLAKHGAKKYEAKLEHVLQNGEGNLMLFIKIERPIEILKIFESLKL